MGQCAVFGYFREPRPNTNVVTVIPAEAGIQKEHWTPAFAGVTTCTRKCFGSFATRALARPVTEGSQSEEPFIHEGTSGPTKDVHDSNNRMLTRLQLPATDRLMACYYNHMDNREKWAHILIRDAAILVRIRDADHSFGGSTRPEFFDVRTGVQLKEIHPAFTPDELERGYPLTPEHAERVLAAGAPYGVQLDEDLSNVVRLLDVKQRRLDSVVADSILDQLRVINDLVRDFLAAAENASGEDRFWLSQQVVSLVRKFSGRELAELQDIVEWFTKRQKK